MNWRPEGWLNPYDKEGVPEPYRRDFETCRQAILELLEEQK